MRLVLGFLVLVAPFGVTAGGGFALDGPKLHDIAGFMAKGGSTELDSELLKHRFSLKEIEEANLTGMTTGIKDALRFMARFEKFDIRVAEPTEVRGNIPVFLPPNTMGDEAYTTCFYAFTQNGLALASGGGVLEVVRPETRPDGPRPLRRWNRNAVLSTRLLHLGYLKPDPILVHYRDRIGTVNGRAILEPNSNILIVTDTAAATGALGEYVDSQVLEAMGAPSSEKHAFRTGPRPPSLGAIASRESIHFYLMTFARSSQIPLAASEERGFLGRKYPEAGLWTNERGYRALESEFQRINEYVRLARETGGEGWNDPSPERVFSPAEQKKLEIRFGVISQSTGASSAQKTKKAGKTARRR
jgi:hypothetical protein